ncbi:MAG TPA: hypothetical protein VFH22_07565, partial [Rhodocyclaceae bacterium]|nr:hypothetical protein [Rhodocyclaceae bacterium]
MNRTAAIRRAAGPSPGRRLALGWGFGVLLGALATGLPRPAHATTPANAMSTPAAEATPPALFPLPANGAAWQQWGSGEMRFFGLRLY